MNLHTSRYLIDGPVGAIEVALDLPDAARLHEDTRQQAALLKGIALVAHPHPLFGGTMDNKVAQTLTRALVHLDYAVFRLNFRGVGHSAGTHDQGIGERDDVHAVIAHMRAKPGLAALPLVLAGFSFGTYVISHVAQQLAAANTPAQRLIMVGTAASRWDIAPVPADTLAIHGEQDETVPLVSVFDWARPQQLPIVVVPGAEHFFHGKLPLLKRIIVDAWRI
jgi:alpha/beta superfamily hydrolase